ncbi:cytochrome c [Belnapia sp. F-4-1]|uniref:cytochrome c n=1 Tax=Belnapia sp. F-4-1 TaxID=1545443 RepID=UPI0005BB3C9B|nr:cytochrome c [Belnapia sp. F-4-1]
MAWRMMMSALALLALGGTALAQGDVIAERRAGLKRMGAHMDAIKPVAEARGDVKALEPRIDDMIAWFRTMPTRFPPGSDRGDTKSLPAVWSERAGFDAANTRMLGQLDVLKAAAASGDAAAFATAFQATGPQFCGGCHRTYRAR